MTHNNYNFLLVGSYVKQSVGMADPYHEGYNNKTVAQLHYGQADRAIRAYKPDIVLLEIGTNDFAWKWGSDGDVPGALASYDSLLTTIYKYAPDVTVLAAPIPPVGPLQTKDDSIKVERIGLYNAGIKNLVDTRASSGKSAVFVEEMYSITLDYIGDGVHPAAPGYSLMGAIWYRAIKALATGTNSARQQRARQPPASLRRVVGRHDVNFDSHCGSVSSGSAYSLNGTQLSLAKPDRGSTAHLRLPARPGVYIVDVVHSDGTVERRTVLSGGSPH